MNQSSLKTNHSAIVLRWSDSKDKWRVKSQLFLFPEKTFCVGQNYSSDASLDNLLVVPGKVARQAAELRRVKSKLGVEPENQNWKHL